MALAPASPCPPWYDESRPILAALTYLEQRDGLPVDGGQLAAFLSLREMWGRRWRQRLGKLLRQWEREGRVRRVPPRDRRASDPRGTPARVPGGWSVRTEQGGEAIMSDDRPLFTSPEQVVRCWATGIPSGCKALPLEPEGGSGSELARASRLYDRSERYAVACAVMRRARVGGLTSAQEVILVALLARERSWDQAAEAAGLEDAELQADSVKQRVYRALHAGLRAVARAM
jgi:hypothetical protein